MASSIPVLQSVSTFVPLCRMLLNTLLSNARTMSELVEKVDLLGSEHIEEELLN